MELLASRGAQVQHFYGAARFPSCQTTKRVTGQGSRHLDTWLMPRELCCELFLRAAGAADVAVVEGHYAPCDAQDVPPSDLTQLAEWLDLPRIGVLDVRRLSDCRLGNAPPELDALLLDGIENCRQLSAHQTNLEALWSVPVIGGMEPLEALRAELRSLGPTARPPDGPLAEMAASLAKFTPVDRIMRLAQRKTRVELRRPQLNRRKRLPSLRIAVAYDEALGCYFPETLELLEQWGAEIVDFSPLRDEVLPTGCDIVYLGCGDIQRHASALSENMCMAASLRNHAFSGRRILAEGAGAAYLCQQAEMDDGRLVPLVGLLPTIARCDSRSRRGRPVEAQLAANCWMGAAATPVRGYRDTCWRFEQAADVTELVKCDNEPADIVAHAGVIASRLHLHLPAQRHLLERIFRPHKPTDVRGDVRAATW